MDRLYTFKGTTPTIKGFAHQKTTKGHFGSSTNLPSQTMLKESNSPRSSVGNKKATCDLARSKSHEQTTPREEREKLRLERMKGK